MEDVFPTPALDIAMPFSGQQMSPLDNVSSFPAICPMDIDQDIFFPFEQPDDVAPVNFPSSLAVDVVEAQLLHPDIILPLAWTPESDEAATQANFDLLHNWEDPLEELFSV
jgi:hypothetical protein